MPVKTVKNLQAELEVLAERVLQLRGERDKAVEERREAESAAHVSKNQEDRADSDNKRLRDELRHVMGQRDQLAGYIEAQRAFTSPNLPNHENGTYAATWLDRFLDRCTETFYYRTSGRTSLHDTERHYSK